MFRKILGSATALATLGLVMAAPAFAENKTYQDPMYKGARLDWCRDWAKNCGKPAAVAFCQNKGFATAATFKQDKDPGGSTKVIGSGKMCEGDNCTSFSSITCTDSKGSDPSSGFGASAQGGSDSGSDTGDDIAQQGSDGEPAQDPNGGNSADNNDADEYAPAKTMMTADLQGVIKSDLSAVAFQDKGQNRVAVFGRGSDGRLWWQAGDGNGKWFGWAAITKMPISVSPSCANSSHGLTCNYIGAGDYIWSITYTGGKWTMNEKTDGLSKSTPGAASYLDEEGKTNIIVFVKDNLGRLVANWKNKDPDTDFWVWHGWTPTGGKISGSPACRQWGPNSPMIYCANKAPNGSTVVHRLKGATWELLKNLGGTTTSRPQIVAGSLTPGFRVLVRGTDGKIWWRESMKSSWTEWKSTPIETSKGPACAIQPGSATDWCFSTGPSGNVIATGFKAESMFQ